MESPVPQSICRARRLTGALLMMTSVAATVGVGAVGYVVATRPPVVQPGNPGSVGIGSRPAVAMPIEFSGRWVGVVAQTDAGTWTADLTLRGGSVNSVIGTSSYPTLNCNGTVTLLGVEDELIHVMETITEDSEDTCADRVPITLAGASDGILDYRNSDTGFGDFHGRLSRQ